MRTGLFYQKIIEENKLAGRVHLYTDFIPAEQVRVFFSAADLVVQPYRSATQAAFRRSPIISKNR